MEVLGSSEKKIPGSLSLVVTPPPYTYWRFNTKARFLTLFLTVATRNFNIERDRPAAHMAI